MGHEYQHDKSGSSHAQLKQLSDQLLRRTKPQKITHPGSASNRSPTRHRHHSAPGSCQRNQVRSAGFSMFRNATAQATSAIGPWPLQQQIGSKHKQRKHASTPQAHISEPHRPRQRKKAINRSGNQRVRLIHQKLRKTAALRGDGQGGRHRSRTTRSAVSSGQPDGKQHTSANSKKRPRAFKPITAQVDKIIPHQSQVQLGQYGAIRRGRPSADDRGLASSSHFSDPLVAAQQHR